MQKLITISSRHLDLLINCMTHSGRPQAASRYGIDRKQVGVWAKVAFEQPFDNFFYSANIAEHEDMTGISASITAGNPPLVGSGCMELRDDQTKRVITEEQCSYNFHQKFLSILKSEQAAFNASRPLNLSRPQIRSGPSAPNPLSSNVRIDNGDRVPKKSAVNARIKQSPFTPNLPPHLRDGFKPASTVTRIVVRDPGASAELAQLGKPPQMVFKTLGGRVVEHDEVEMY